MLFYVGWNVLGEEPDEAPLVKETWDEAKSVLKSEFSWLILEDEQLSEDAINAASALDIFGDNPWARGGSFTYIVGSFVYWIRKSVDVTDGAIRQL